MSMIPELNKKTVYKMEVGSGGGTWTDGGDFEVHETPKVISFVCIREPFFSNRMSEKRKHKEVEGLYVWKPLKINKYYSGKDKGKPAWHYDEGYTQFSNNGHVAKFYDDGEITVYPDQSGVPHVLTPNLS